MAVFRISVDVEGDFEYGRRSSTGGNRNNFFQHSKIGSEFLVLTINETVHLPRCLQGCWP